MRYYKSNKKNNKIFYLSFVLLLLLIIPILVLSFYNTLRVPSSDSSDNSDNSVIVEPGDDTYLNLAYLNKFYNCTSSNFNNSVDINFGSLSFTDKSGWTSSDGIYSYSYLDNTDNVPATFNIFDNFNRVYYSADFKLVDILSTEYYSKIGFKILDSSYNGFFFFFDLKSNLDVENVTLNSIIGSQVGIVKIANGVDQWGTVNFPLVLVNDVNLNTFDYREFNTLSILFDNGNFTLYLNNLEIMSVSSSDFDLDVGSYSVSISSFNSSLLLKNVKNFKSLNVELDSTLTYDKDNRISYYNFSKGNTYLFKNILPGDISLIEQLNGTRRYVYRNLIYEDVANDNIDSADLVPLDKDYLSDEVYNSLINVSSLNKEENSDFTSFSIVGNLSDGKGVTANVSGSNYYYWRSGTDSTIFDVNNYFTAYIVDNSIGAIGFFYFKV